MMRKEFEQMTGIFPSIEVYALIEEAYYEFDGSKQEFCKAFKENRDGLAETIQSRANDLYYRNEQQNKVLIERHANEIDKLNRKIAELQRDLDYEQDWQPHEPSGIKQADYDALRKSGRQMTDDEAIDWVVAETGFQRERVSIIRSIPGEEINRHHQIRRTDRMIDRSPVYDATDWHYILFRVTANVAWYYELHNDELKPFAC